MECVVKEGSDCKLELGSPIRIYDEKPVEKETKPMAQETKVEDAAPAPEPAPVPEPAPAPAPGCRSALHRTHSPDRAGRDRFRGAGI